MFLKILPEQYQDSKTIKCKLSKTGIWDKQSYWEFFFFLILRILICQMSGLNLP